jgi:hypothetical protein
VNRALMLSTLAQVASIIAALGLAQLVLLALRRGRLNT